MADENEVVAPTDAELSEARELGWADKDSWRGKPEHWVDAKTFLDRGRHVLPIMAETNRRLKGQLETQGAQLQSVNTALKAAQASIDALEESHEADVVAVAEEARIKLREELTEASREGRHEDVADLTVKLTELNTAQPEKKKKKEETEDNTTAARPDPVFLAWAADNQAFMNDPRRVALANQIAREIRETDKTTVGRPFMDKVADEVDKLLGAKATRTSKAEAGGGGGRGAGGGGGSEGGKTFADLPQEAKDACARAAKRVVGEGRAHKTMESWQRAYATKFFAQE